MAVEICREATGADRLSTAGIDVVLVLAEGVPFAAGRRGPGRIAVFVTGTEPGVDPDLTPAATMGAEIFGV